MALDGPLACDNTDAENRKDRNIPWNLSSVMRYFGKLKPSVAHGANNCCVPSAC